MAEKIKIEVQLSEKEAIALARFTKRAASVELSNSAVDDIQAVMTIGAIYRLQGALAKQGYSSG